MNLELWKILVPVLLGILVVIITKLWDPIAERVGYPWDVSQRVKDLQDAVERLRSIQADLHRLDPRPSSEQGKGWVRSVQNLCLKEEKIKTGYDGCGLNYFSYCYFGKQADQELKKAADLIDTGKELLKEAQARPDPIRDALPQRPQDQLWGMDMDLDSYKEKKVPDFIQVREDTESGYKHQVRDLLHVGRNLSPLHGIRMASYETKVLDFVERETIVVPWLLGISGMRGVGKTTLLRFVRDSYAHDSSFSYVFFLGAGTGCTVESLQHALSSNIQMPDDVPISTCLEGKPFLLLLDDVRERLDLAAVGLPTPLGHRQKVIFTTRNHQICADMGCSSNTSIQMECLSEDDAWDLFKDKVGEENIDAHPHIKHLAKKMAAECRGLPSALCALGRAMSTKTDVKEWRYAYDVLKRKQTPVSEIQETDDEGHSDLEEWRYGYDVLKRKQTPVSEIEARYSDVYHLQDKLQDLFF